MGGAKRGSGWARRACGGVLGGVVLLACLRSARAQNHALVDEPSTTVPASDLAFPTRLSITVVADERLLATFQQRVSSWFTDGTEVSVIATSEMDTQQLLVASSGEVRAWVVPLSAERALVTFSTLSPRAPTRHLVREVRLRSGLDDLGLERLASVIHSAFVALREGDQGVERAQAERELGEAGVAPGARNPPAEFAATPAPLPAPATSTRPLGAAQRVDRVAIPAATPRAELLLGAGYGAQLRGAEGLGHGPNLALGAQLPSTPSALDFLVSGQFSFRSAFDTELFGASVQTTALRCHVGIEPELGSSWFAQALLGAGVDIAQIHSGSVPSSSLGNTRTDPRASGTQWRSAGQLTLGVVRHAALLDFGVYAQVNFWFEDVHYAAATDSGEQRLVAPWPIQPGLTVQARFRSAL